ncbi:MAG: PEP-CTERM sorting domain-containing protein [Thauera sp.]
MKTKLLSLLVAGLTSGLLATSAQAASLYCADGDQTESISAADMGFNSVAADDCYGVVAGNLNEKEVAPYANDNSLWDGGWGYLVGTASDTSTLIGDISFSLSADINSVTGDWTLTATDSDPDTEPNLPLTLDFAALLKSGTKYAFWFFDDRSVDVNNDGTFTIKFTNNGGQFGELSHMDLLWRTGDEGGSGDQDIPEPGPLSLLGLGLMGLWFARRKTNA